MEQFHIGESQWEPVKTLQGGIRRRGTVEKQNRLGVVQEAFSEIRLEHGCLLEIIMNKILI